MRIRHPILLAAALLAPAAASAHPGHETGPGPLTGLAHALFGHDHAAALAGIGAAAIVAAMVGWRALARRQAARTARAPARKR